MEKIKKVRVRIEAMGFEGEKKDAFKNGLFLELKKNHPELLKESDISIFFIDGLYMSIEGALRRSVKISSTDAGMTATYIKNAIISIEQNMEVYECGVRC